MGLKILSGPLVLGRGGGLQIKASSGPVLTYLTGQVSWHKADALALSDNAPIATWADSSGNGNTASNPNVPTRPVYKASAIGGRPAALFTQATQQWLTAETVTSAQPTTIFVVCKYTATGTLAVLYDGVTARQHVWCDGTSNNYTYFAGTVRDTGVAADANAHVLCQTYNGASSGFWKDGTSISTANPGATALTYLAIGANQSFANFWSGHIAEIIVYSGALNATNRGTVTTYLGAKYGITVV